LPKTTPAEKMDQRIELLDAMCLDLRRRLNILFALVR
jgi:hypothetical protein